MTYPTFNAKPERNAHIVARREAGERYTDIAVSYDLSAPRVRQIVERHRRRAKADRIGLRFTCHRCDWRWLEKGSKLRVRCPHCGNGYGHLCENT